MRDPITQQTAPIGTLMADGSVFAGMTADRHHYILTTPSHVGLTMTFNKAAEAVTALNEQKACGHSDWRIPGLDILKVLFTNKEAGALKGTFDAGEGHGLDHPEWCWSSTEHSSMSVNVWALRFTDSRVHWSHKDGNRLSCRPVRLIPCLPDLRPPASSATA